MQVDRKNKLQDVCGGRKEPNSDFCGECHRIIGSDNNLRCSEATIGKRKFCMEHGKKRMKKKKKKQQ